MSWLVLLFAAELGLAQDGLQVDNSLATMPWTPYTELEAGVRILGTLELRGSAKTYESGVSDTAYFSPFLGDYGFIASLTFGDFEAGYEHRCVHPILGVYEGPDIRRVSDRIYLRAAIER